MSLNNKVKHYIQTGLCQNKVQRGSYRQQVYNTASHPLSVSDAAVVAVVSLEVWVSSVPPGIHITLWSEVTQKAVRPLRVNINLTDRDHL